MCVTNLNITIYKICNYKQWFRKLPKQIILFTTVNAIIITIKFLWLSTLQNVGSFILESTFKVTWQTTWIFLQGLVWIAEQPEARIFIFIILETNTAWATSAKFIFWVKSSTTSWILAKVCIACRCTYTSCSRSASNNWKWWWTFFLDKGIIYSSLCTAGCI